MIHKCSILNGRKYFSADGSQNYLVFQPVFSYFTFKNGKIHSWQSKRMPEGSIKSLSITDHSFDPEIIYKRGDIKIKFNGICVKQDGISFIYGNVVNLYISDKLDTLSRDLK